jgi:hypothetical protein
MRVLAILLAVALAGCASRPTVSYDQMASIHVDDNNCPNIDQITAGIQQQLRLLGTLDKNPEDMTEYQRQYNEKAKIIIWSLRIGCNNPDRYKS